MFTQASMLTREATGLGTGKVQLSKYFTPEDAQKVLRTADGILSRRQARSPQNAKLIQVVAGGRASKNLDLSGLNLSNSRLLEKSRLQNVNLGGANLSQSSLAEAQLENVNLRSASMAGANLSNAKLSRVDLSDANLDRSQLYLSKINDASLDRTSLVGANLRGSTFKTVRGQNTTFTQANMSGVHVKKSEFKNAQFNGVNLENASLYANVYDSEFSQVSGKNVRLDGIFRRNRFHQTDLSKAHLKGVSAESQFSSTSLENARLNGLDFSDNTILNANLDRTQWENVRAKNLLVNNAWLRHADIANSNLEDSKLNDVDLQETLLKENTLDRARWANTALSNTYLLGNRGDNATFNLTDAQHSRWLSNHFSNGVFSGNFNQARARNNVGLPDQPGMRRLPDTVSARELDATALTPEQEQQEVNRVQSVAAALQIPSQVKPGIVNFLAAFPEENTINFNPRMTAKLDDNALQVVLAHEQGHIHHLDPGYINISDRDKVKLVLHELATNPNHQQETRADRYAVDYLLGQGRTPEQVKQMFYQLAEASSNTGDPAQPLATSIAATHPSLQQRYARIANYLNSVAKSQGGGS